MENKTTTELVDLLEQKIDKDGNLLEGYEEAKEELKTRDVFFEILNEDYPESLPALSERIDEIEEKIKKLKRHKHDPNSGDVLIRL